MRCVLGVMLKKAIKDAVLSGASSALKRLISPNLPDTENIWRSLQLSYSQLGEDLLILAALSHFRRNEIAYYVDVGAFDPVHFSNTFRLHQRGWLGINIDPNPNNISKFRSQRPNDVNLEVALSCEVGESEFLFYESETTGRLAKQGKPDNSILGEIPISRSKVKTETLSRVLQTHAPRGLDFGLLSIDCEGADLEVLASNDWDLFRPWIIAIEDHSLERNSLIDEFAYDKGYKICGQALVTKIFYRSDLG